MKLELQKSWNMTPGRERKFDLYTNSPWFTLPKLNSSPPEKLPGPKRKVVFQPSFFRVYLKLPWCIYNYIQGSRSMPSYFHGISWGISAGFHLEVTAMDSHFSGEFEDFFVICLEKRYSEWCPVTLLASGSVLCTVLLATCARNELLKRVHG